MGENYIGKCFMCEKETNIINGMCNECVEPVDEIVTDQEFLKQVSKETSMEEVKKLKLVERIIKTLPKAWTPGCGLAAIQIGIPIRAAWYRVIPQDHTGKILINPKIISQSDPYIFPGEGCLSIPGQRISTKRFNKIILENNGKTRQVEGFEAVLIQHEIDHLDGILNTERKYDRTKRVGRNDLCPCLSGKKYKKCCLK